MSKASETGKAVQAYYAGRNAAWGLIDGGQRTECPFTDKTLISEWREGFRRACAEERLSVDTEWD